MTDDISKKFDQYRTKLREAATANSAAVFGALAGAGVTAVAVEFDGEGDSGGVTSIAAFRGDDQVALANMKVTYLSVAWGETTAIATEEPVETAIESLCYSCLEQKQLGGWENNEGAFGTFEITVADRRIALEFNARFTDVSTHTYEF